MKTNNILSQEEICFIDVYYGEAFWIDGKKCYKEDEGSAVYGQNLSRIKLVSKTDVVSVLKVLQEMNLTLEITQEHINKASRNNIHADLIVNAVRDVIGEEDLYVYATYDNLQIEGVYYRHDAKQLLVDFDNGLEVKPTVVNLVRESRPRR